MESKVLVYDISSEGHRANYVNFLSDILGGRPLIAPWWQSLPELLSWPIILFSTYETKPIVLTIITLLRSLLRKKTRIIILRPLILIAGPLSFLKIAAHRLLAMAPNVRLIVLMDLPEHSHLSGQVDHLADPEYWDVPKDKRACETELSIRIGEEAGDDRILLFAGQVSGDKGIDFLLDLLSHPDWTKLDIKLVIAGKVAPAMVDRIKHFRERGAILENRFLSDEELFSLFGKATYSWCCYDPSRDMTSGIYGRSCQFGVWPIIRAGSALEKNAKDGGFGTAIAWLDVESAMSVLKEIEPVQFSDPVDPQEQLDSLNTIIYR